MTRKAEAENAGDMEKLHNKFSRLTDSHKTLIMGAAVALQFAQEREGAAERDGREEAGGSRPPRVL